MARHLGTDDNDAVYRAVITETSTRGTDEPNVYTFTLGPYTSAAQAKAQITRARRDAERTTVRDAQVAERIRARHPDYVPAVVTAAGRVERAATTWEGIQ